MPEELKSTIELLEWIRCIMIDIKHQGLLKNPTALIDRIEGRLGHYPAELTNTAQGSVGRVKGSAVLFLLTPCRVDRNIGFEPCLLLNKRSQQVLQPGDLCCPGGGVEPRDRWLSQLLRLPFSPLGKWTYWRRFKAGDFKRAKQLALLMATGLREAWEEMRLNPLKVRFLGPLAAQRLIMFDRVIQPLAGWIPKSQNLSSNGEVDRIVHIPLRRLLDHHNYGRYRLDMTRRGETPGYKQDFPCFIHRGRRGQELLWGATFRITLDFLTQVFDFEHPGLNGAPLYVGRLGKSYLKGSSLSRNPVSHKDHSEHF